MRCRKHRCFQFTNNAQSGGRAFSSTFTENKQREGSRNTVGMEAKRMECYTALCGMRVKPTGMECGSSSPGAASAVTAFSLSRKFKWNFPEETEVVNKKIRIQSANKCGERLAVLWAWEEFLKGQPSHHVYVRTTNDDDFMHWPSSLHSRIFRPCLL